jgi:HEAT repeat protein
MNDDEIAHWQAMIRTGTDEERLEALEIAQQLAATNQPDVVPHLIEAMRHEHGSLHVPLEKAIASMGSVAVPVMIRLLDDPQEDVHLRRNAIFILSWIDDMRGAERILEAVHDRMPAVRKDAVEVIGNIGNRYGDKFLQRTSEAVLSVLNNELDFISMYAIGSAGQLRLFAAMPILIEALHHQHHEIQYRAARALGLMRYPEAVSPLIDALQVSHSSIQRQIVQALKRIGTPEALAAVEEYQQKR